MKEMPNFHALVGSLRNLKAIANRENLCWRYGKNEMSGNIVMKICLRKSEI